MVSRAWEARPIHAYIVVERQKPAKMPDAVGVEVNICPRSQRSFVIAFVLRGWLRADWAISFIQSSP